MPAVSPSAKSLAPWTNPLTPPVAGQGGCQGGDKCLTHALWRDLSERLTGFLNNITLGELVNNREILDVSGRQHQHETQRNARTRDAIDVKLRA